MKHSMLIALLASAFTALAMAPVAAVPLAPLTASVTSSQNELIVVKHGGRGHHYGWTKSRGLHLGFVRGRHLGWR
jgi:hypothetical protein